MRFGKLAPKLSYSTLRFSNYLDFSNLPTSPKAYDTLQAVYTKTGNHNPSHLFPMDGNDNYGDCTCAGIAHALTLYNGLIGKTFIPTKDVVVREYLSLSGGEDSGLAELDVLHHFTRVGMFGHKGLAFVRLNPANLSFIKLAIFLFGGVYLGFQVQEDAISDFQARKIWQPGKLTSEGHAVFATSYTPETVTLLTWGNTQVASWKWWAQCVDECYAILPDEALSTNYHPGFNLTHLKQDLAKLKS